MYCADIRTQNGLFRKQLEKASNKNMFRLLRSLDGQRVQQPPEFRLAAQGCEIFSRFIRGKIDNVLSGLQWFNDVDRPSDERRCFTDCIDVFDRLIEQRAQRSQRFVVLLRKRACWILCLQISSLTTSYCACHHRDHKCFSGRGSDAEVVKACNCPTTFKETITGQRHPEQLPTSE